MFKFITHQGSYTLVLKPEDSKIVYDHKGAPVRMEGTQYIEFVNIRGTKIGQFTTNNPAIAEALRKHKYCGTSFTEIREGDKMPVAEQSGKTVMMSLPKAALLACKKEELLDIAKKYKLEMNIEEETKKSLVEKILTAQSSQGASVVPQHEPRPGEINVIRQEVRA